MHEVKQFMLEFGYDDKGINKIVNTYPIPNLKPETLLKNIKELYLFFISFGYNKLDIIKMSISSPSILTFSKEYINKRITDLINIGYTKEDIIKITKSSPNIYGYSIDNINKKISALTELGYTKEQVLKMTKSLSSLFSYSIKTIIKKIDDLILLGYTREEVFVMTINLPNIYGLNIDNIKEKIIFYKSIQLDKLFVKHTNLLMQSVDLSYARYYFLKSKDIRITDENYRRLFMNQKEFINCYGITNKELIQKYKYKKDNKENIK